MNAPFLVSRRPGRRTWPRLGSSLVAALAIFSSGCAAFNEFERAQATRHDGCVRACEQVLGQTSLGYDDGKGHCTCYSPSQGWERSGSVSMARISLASYPTRLASREAATP